MSDEEPTGFTFTSARPKGQAPNREARAQSKAPDTRLDTPAAADPETIPRRRGRPKEDQPPLKVDLLHAIKAAAILDETDANAFAAIVKVLNAQPASARNRIARALVMVFG